LDGYDNIKERLKKRAAPEPKEPDGDEGGEASGGAEAAGKRLKEALASGDGAAICAAAKACANA
jgi:hypothetical protein